MTAVIQDLPEEMLVHIFSYLDFDDRKVAATVCRHWSGLALRWGDIQLEVDFRRSGVESTYHQVLMASQRPYRHVTLFFGHDYAKCALLLDILSQFASTLDTLTILPNSFIPVELVFLAQVAGLCPTLKRLHVDVCTFQNKPYTEIRFPPLNNLFDLYVENNLLDLREIDIRETMPNVTGLHVQISYYSKRPQAVLQHFGNRLQELEVWFLTEDHFPSVCEMNFPLLKKVNFYCVDCNFDDFRMIGQFATFFQHCPELVEATLRCNINAPVLNTITQICTNLQSLCLSIEDHSAECFRSLSELHNLKRLRIEDASISVPEMEYYVVFKNLHTLTLYSVQIVHSSKFNSFMCSCFPKLATLELLNICCGMNQAEMFKLHSSICSNLNTLERLVLCESERLLDLDLFFYFASLVRLRELRLEFRSLTDYICPYDTNLLYVRTLILHVPQMHDESLRKLIQLLPKIRLIMLSKNNGFSVDGIRAISDQLPECDIRVKRRVQVSWTNLGSAAIRFRRSVSW
ncbi:uncharacterized protein LOC129717704 [Wyeomyia smithii]|uniref:uncharacterized protein LOC129717704 n=1 Tax=Wyeomyia smithii TaxID=174621 RepID=UPI0024680843|nr:uncharacterized protein LOC129717704 [Wyeomyia smithii]